jgi:hypothetical protein
VAVSTIQGLCFDYRAVGRRGGLSGDLGTRSTRPATNLGRAGRKGLAVLASPTRRAEELAQELAAAELGETCTAPGIVIAAASASRLPTCISHPPPGSSLRTPQPARLSRGLSPRHFSHPDLHPETHTSPSRNPDRERHTLLLSGLTDHPPPHKHTPAYPVLSLRPRRGAARRYATPPPPILPAATPEKDRPRPVPGNSTPAIFAHCGTKLTREAPPPGGFRPKRSAAVPLNASFASRARDRLGHPASPAKMVYCGKPSKGCSNCRERKIRVSLIYYFFISTHRMSRRHRRPVTARLAGSLPSATTTRDRPANTTQVRPKRTGLWPV